MVAARAVKRFFLLWPDRKSRLKRSRGWMCTGYEPRRRNPAKENRESISSARVRSSQKWRALSCSGLCTGSLWRGGELFNFYLALIYSWLDGFVSQHSFTGFRKTWVPVSSTTIDQIHHGSPISEILMVWEGETSCIRDSRRFFDDWKRLDDWSD